VLGDGSAQGFFSALGAGSALGFISALEASALGDGRALGDGSPLEASVFWKRHPNQHSSPTFVIIKTANNLSCQL